VTTQKVRERGLRSHPFKSVSIRSIVFPFCYGLVGATLPHCMTACR